jgi:DUF2934 family protein
MGRSERDPKRGGSPMPSHGIGTSRNIPTYAHPNLEEEIRRLAFELYVERGRKHGRDLDDWLNAEAEVLCSVVKRPSTMASEEKMRSAA